jgi:hypothetical protein
MAVTYRMPHRRQLRFRHYLQTTMTAWIFLTSYAGKVILPTLVLCQIPIQRATDGTGYGNGGVETAEVAAEVAEEEEAVEGRAAKKKGIGLRGYASMLL